MVNMKQISFLAFLNQKHMSSKKKIRCYDYINHPFENVKAVVQKNITEIFKNATKSASARAKNVAAELHVNVAGFEFGKDIDITIKGIRESPKSLGTPPSISILLEWAAHENSKIFPMMEGDLTLYPLTSTETQLDFSGEYEVPLGVIGGMLNAVGGHRIAEASVLRFVQDIAVHLRNEL